MLSKLSQALVKLSGIFLILYISASSATPTGQPGEAQNINDEIHPRDTDGLCVEPYTLIRRECLGGVSPVAWQDICAWWGGYQTVYDNKRGNCPDGTYCLDGFDNTGRRSISCVGASNDKKRKSDSQVGTSEAKRARTFLGNSQIEYSVTIDHDMTGASVAAVVRSECRSINAHCRILSLLM